MSLHRSEPAEGNGRRMVIAVLVFLALLIAAVVIPLVTIGLHNNGVKPPPAPSPTRSVPISRP